MFAVKGWSVPVSQLKTQAETPKAANKNKNKSDSTPQPSAYVESTEETNKKRKRNGNKSKTQDVDKNNLADMWESVIEGKTKEETVKERGEKRQKISDGTSAAATEDVKEDDKLVEKPRLKIGKTKKEKKREKRAKLLEAQSESKDPTEAAAPIAKVPPIKIEPKLTPLQAAMRQKLISARFRHLNQTLYTTPSAHSLSLFAENPEMFNEYHEGFRKQVEVWPENPVDGYISSIKSRAVIRGKGKDGKESGLPRTEGTCYIADLGCGDAALATALQPHTKKFHLKIHSFDLQSPSPLVTKADIANLPLQDDSVDVAIFCLALMGTNWVDFIEEAFRILRWKGELWIAEIKSRFGRVGGKGGRVEHSVGNKKRPLDKKEKKRVEEEADDAVAAVEVDGMEDKGAETDVSAFVEVLRKRGFVLKGEGQGGEKDSIDLSNRMFVRMWFVKGATPVKGKGVPVPKGMDKFSGSRETWKKKQKGGFVEEEETHVQSESGVLKPCVYKLR